MNHLCGKKLQLTTLENSINCQSAERIGKGKHGGRAPATKLRSRNKSLLTQSIRNIEEERGRVPIPLSIVERMLAWGSWWMMRENKFRCRSQGWLYHTVPLQLDPKWAAKTTRGSLEWSRNKTFSASAAPLAQSSSSLPPLIGQRVSLAVPWIMERIFYLGLETHFPSCSVPLAQGLDVHQGLLCLCSPGRRCQEYSEQREITVLPLLPRDEKTETISSLFHITRCFSFGPVTTQIPLKHTEKQIPLSTVSDNFSVVKNPSLQSVRSQLWGRNYLWITGVFFKGTDIMSTLVVQQT